jgi:hypothetical protein
MPILKFSGVSAELVKKYSQLVNEIGELVGAASENIIFIDEKSEIFPKNGDKCPIYITVE